MTPRSLYWMPALAALASLALADGALADIPALRRSPEMVAAFDAVVARPSESTVRVQADGSDAALGAIVSPDGFIVTKGTLLKGKLSCKLKDGRSFDAEYVGLDTRHDLAMLKIKTSGLRAVDWAPSKAAEVGDWVAAPGNGAKAVAVGVVGVAARKPHRNEFLREPPPKGSGYLGVFLSEKPGGATIGGLEPGGPAAKAGLKMGDSVVAVEGRKIPTTERLIAVIKALKSGSTITLTIKRAGKQQEVKVRLGERPLDRGWLQNSMGSELSKRRDVPIFLQHDLVIKPADCGGPLVNLDGKTVGINIARGGRTESYALPSEVVQGLLADLKSGKLAPPKGNDPARVAQLEMDLDGAEAALTVAQKALERAEKEGKRREIRGLKLEIKEIEDNIKSLKKQLAEPRIDASKK